MILSIARTFFKPNSESILNCISQRNSLTLIWLTHSKMFLAAAELPYIMIRVRPAILFTEWQRFWGGSWVNSASLSMIELPRTSSFNTIVIKCGV